jgi:hypothetical protein
MNLAVQVVPFLRQLQGTGEIQRKLAVGSGAHFFLFSGFLGGLPSIIALNE